MRKNKRLKTSIVVFCLMCMILSSCGSSKVATSSGNTQRPATGKPNVIDVRFSVKDRNNELNLLVVEDKAEAKQLGKEHSVKYYSYMPNEKKDSNFSYFDVFGNKREMVINENVPKNNYLFADEEGVFSKIAPDGYDMTYGIDVSKHNGDIDFKKVKDSGFDFVFLRIAYRGYGKQGNLKQDEMWTENIKKAKEAGLKVGAYVFSQAQTEEEALVEAKFAIEVLGNEKLDLPLVFDPETIKNHVARTDNVTGEQFTKNAIAFMEEVKKYGLDTAFYSNMVWEDYYFDMEKLKDYKVWYADYNNKPQTPYDFTYWQFSEKGYVDGVEGEVDLNVMLIENS